MKWIDFYYMQKLLNKEPAIADAKVLVEANQPVGVPALPVFDKATYDQNMQWINAIRSTSRRRTSRRSPDRIFDQTLVAEPNKHTQELYGALDSVVQAVLTDKNADIDALLARSTPIQALIDADAAQAYHSGPELVDRLPAPTITEPDLMTHIRSACTAPPAARPLHLGARRRAASTLLFLLPMLRDLRRLLLVADRRSRGDELPAHQPRQRAHLGGLRQLRRRC